MAWIESHQELAAHPKTRRFARALGITVPAAIGHLHLLWWWALDYAQDGDLGRFEPAEIAEACMWDGDAGMLVTALGGGGWIDESRYLHDWHDYAGKLLEQRARERQRSAQRRADEAVRRATDQRPADDRQTTAGTVPNRTVGTDAPAPTDLTKPDQTEPAAAATPPCDVRIPRPRKRPLTIAAIAEIQVEFPHVDVQSLAEDYLNWKGSADQNDQVTALRNQCRDPRRQARFPRDALPFDGTAAFAGVDLSFAERKAKYATPVFARERTGLEGVP